MNLLLTYDPESNSYWFDNEGKRYWFDNTIEAFTMSKMAFAIRAGQLRITPTPVEVPPCPPTPESSS
jgi:hypothetical protein